MPLIEFSTEEKAAITQKLQRYLADELQVEIGGFDAEFLLDFFSKEIGCFFYNRGLYDAQTVLSKRFEEITDAVVALEKFEEQHRNQQAESLNACPSALGCTLGMAIC